MDVPESPGDALRETLRTLSVAAALANPEPLRKQVCELVSELKKSGMTPERVVLTVKALVFEANREVAEVGLLQQIVRWCIEQYFSDE
jgi:hypothetical protein